MSTSGRTYAGQRTESGITILGDGDVVVGRTIKHFVNGRMSIAFVFEDATALIVTVYDDEEVMVGDDFAPHRFCDASALESAGLVAAGEHARREAVQREKHEAYERAEYARLKAKFEPVKFEPAPPLADQRVTQG